jgi:hypothetical protein
MEKQKKGNQHPTQSCGLTLFGIINGLDFGHDGSKNFSKIEIQ